MSTVVTPTWSDPENDPPRKNVSEEDFKKEGFTIEAKVLILNYDKDVMIILHPNGTAYRLRVD